MNKRSICVAALWPLFLKNILQVSMVSVVVSNCATQLGGGGIEEDVAIAETVKVECDESLSVEYDKRVTSPDMMLVVDKSGSMGTPDGDPWRIMHRTLVTLVNDNSGLSFGLQLYPTGGKCKAGAVEVLPESQNSQQIIDQLDQASPGGHTPTDKALDSVRIYYEGVADEDKNPDGLNVLLVTDGEQHCSKRPAAQVANTLFDMGIKTFVLGYGNGASSGEMNSIANAGGSYTVYNANNSSQLSDAFDDFVKEVQEPSCEIKLKDKPSNSDALEIKIDGIDISKSDANGWNYQPDDQTIVFTGSTCKAIKDGGDNIAIDVYLGCHDIPIE